MSASSTKGMRRTSSTSTSDANARSQMYSVFTTGRSSFHDTKASGKNTRMTSLAHHITTGKRASKPSGFESNDNSDSRRQELKIPVSSDRATLRHFSRSRAKVRAIKHYIFPHNEGLAKSRDLFMHPYSLRFFNSQAEEQYAQLMRKVHHKSRKMGSSPSLCGWWRG